MVSPPPRSTHVTLADRPLPSPTAELRLSPFDLSLAISHVVSIGACKIVQGTYGSWESPAAGSQLSCSASACLSSHSEPLSYLASLIIRYSCSTLACAELSHCSWRLARIV